MNFFYTVQMPIAHSLSPFSSKAVFEGLGLKNFRYELCECASLDDPASTFKEDITNPKSLGCAVTIPHKMSVIPYLDGLSDTAKAVGSVNLTYYECDAKSGEERHIGTNTDVEGVRVVLISALTGAITPFPKDLPQTFEKGTAAGLCIGKSSFIALPRRDQDCLKHFTAYRGRRSSTSEYSFLFCDLRLS